MTEKNIKKTKYFENEAPRNTAGYLSRRQRFAQQCGQVGTANKAVLAPIDNIFCFVIISIVNPTALSAFAGTAVFVYE